MWIETLNGGVQVKNDIFFFILFFLTRSIKVDKCDLRSMLNYSNLLTTNSSLIKALLTKGYCKGDEKNLLFYRNIWLKYLKIKILAI